MGRIGTIPLVRRGVTRVRRVKRNRDPPPVPLIDGRSCPGGRVAWCAPRTRRGRHGIYVYRHSRYGRSWPAPRLRDHGFDSRQGMQDGGAGGYSGMNGAEIVVYRATAAAFLTDGEGVRVASGTGFSRCSLARVCAGVWVHCAIFSHFAGVYGTLPRSVPAPSRFQLLTLLPPGVYTVETRTTLYASRIHSATSSRLAGGWQITQIVTP
jgi:hypothetical protein